MKNKKHECTECEGTGKLGWISQSNRGYGLAYCNCKKGKEVKKWEKENKGGNIYWGDKC